MGLVYFTQQKEEERTRAVIPNAHTSASAEIRPRSINSGDTQWIVPLGLL